jgi:hypothetical protein
MKRRYLLTLFALFLILVPYVFAATNVTLETQPPSDPSDCTVGIDVNGIAWISNGYVNITCNTPADLHNATFYRGTQKVLTLDFDQSYINKTEYGAPPPPDRVNITFYKIQFLNHTSQNWTDVPSDGSFLLEFAYRQQIGFQVIWQDDPDTPSYILAGSFIVTRGMPWVQVEWQITNLLGVAYDLEFVPCGIFYIPSDTTILSSNLRAWNETTAIYNTGNPWANNYAWFTVGFTTNGSSIDNPSMENNTRIFLNNTESEILDPLPYEAIIGDSDDAFWAQNYTFGEPVPPYCQYNYTFILQNLDTVDSWHFAELWLPQNVTWVGFYFSTDNGTTWENGIGYNWETQEPSGTQFQTTNGTSINATIYDLSVASGSSLNISTTAGSDNPELYNYSSLLGVYDRVALGVSLWGDTGEDWFNSSSACFIKVQVTFTGNAQYWFDYDYSNFETEPGQGYGLLNQTDGRLYFIDDQNSSAPAWAIGMNQTLRHLRVTSYPNGTLENVLFSWNQTLLNATTGAFTMNVFGFLSLDTTAFAEGDPDIPDIFEFGADNPRFQIHEAFIKTAFEPLQTYVSGSQRRYILNWTQTLTTTDWNSTGNYTIAMVEYNRTVNGWAPITTPNWLYRRSSSPTVDIFDSEGETSIEFYLTSLPPTLPPGRRETPTTTPPETGITPPPANVTASIIIGAIIILAAVLYLWRKR